MNEMEILRGLGAPTAATPSERARVREALIERMDDDSVGKDRADIGVGRRLRRPAVLAVAALFAVGTITVVGAAIFIEWGPVDHPATAAQVRAEIADTQAVTPLPPGQTYPDLFAKTDPNNLAKFLGVQQVQFFAMCAWSNYWLDGHQADNGQQMATAFAVIKDFPTWKSIADPRLADDSIRKEIAEVVAGAQTGDAAPVELLVQAACPARG
jgi:hypothetical protein